MFIPNKTFHAIRAGILSVIAFLLCIITVASVLYNQSVRSQTAKLNQISARVDSLANLSTRIDANSVNRDTQVQEQLTNAETNIKALQSMVDESRTTIKLLIKNECTYLSYYRMSDMCQP